jgi:hypothetical protein
VFYRSRRDSLGIADDALDARHQIREFDCDMSVNLSQSDRDHPKSVVS